MNTIQIPLREDNLAEVLAGVAILGILETHSPRTNKCVWLDQTLEIETAMTESALASAVYEFLSSSHWVQSLGDVHQGVFKSGDFIGVSPFMDFADEGTPSSFKNFSGQVTTAKISADQREAAHQLKDLPLAEMLLAKVNDVSSWGLDWRTNAHSLDIGFSANDDNTSKFNPVFLAVDALATAALGFFLPHPCLFLKNEVLAYHLWETPLPAALAAQAFLGNINGLAGRTYRVSRRPKSYGKGASYKYFPAAVLQN